MCGLCRQHSFMEPPSYSRIAVPSPEDGAGKAHGGRPGPEGTLNHSPFRRVRRENSLFMYCPAFRKRRKQPKFPVKALAARAKLHGPGWLTRTRKFAVPETAQSLQSSGTLPPERQ
jgi:hypothetical protein